MNWNGGGEEEEECIQGSGNKLGKNKYLRE
jgi:hypothetical protein